MKTNFEQRNYHYWKNGKRENAIGVIITIPSKHKKILDKINVTFVGRDFCDE